MGMGLNLLDYPSLITDESIQFLIPGKREAWTLLEQCFYELATITQNGGFQSTILRFPGGKRPLKVTARQAKEYLKMPQNLNFGNCEIPHELLRYVFGMAESTTPQGLVRCDNSKQIILTENNKIVTPNCGTLLGATRDRYWKSDDLERFETEWRRSLRDDGSNWFEFHYAIHDLDQPGVNLQQKHNRYRLVLDLQGTPYHICESLD